MQEILNKTAIVALTVSIWSGRRVLEAQDVGLNESEIPDVVRLGSKKIFDPDKLAPFNTLKRRAERLFSIYGIRFLNGYAVPVEKLDELTQYLNEVKTEFQNTLEAFLGGYKDNLEAWAEQHPALAESMLRAAPDEAYLRKHISFSYQVFSVAPAEKYEENLEEQVSGMAGQLRKEIRDAARLIWKSSLAPANGNMASLKVLKPIRILIDKMDGLSYLDGKIVQDTDFHRGILNGMPDKGPIIGGDLLRLRSSVLLLSEIALTTTEAESMIVTATEDESKEDEDNKVEVEPEPELASEHESVMVQSPDTWF